MGGHLTGRGITPLLEPPLLPLGVGRVERQPSGRLLGLDGTAIPVDEVVGEFDALHGGGEDVPADEDVEIPVGEVVGEVEDDPLLEQPLDRLPEPLAELILVERAGGLKRQRRIEPASDRLQGRLLPGDHRFEEAVFRLRGERAEVDLEDRLVEIRLDLVAQLRVAEQAVDFVRFGVTGDGHAGLDPRSLESAVEGSSGSAAGPNRPHPTLLRSTIPTPTAGSTNRSSVSGPFSRVEVGMTGTSDRVFAAGRTSLDCRSTLAFGAEQPASRSGLSVGVGWGEIAGFPVQNGPLSGGMPDFQARIPFTTCPWTSVSRNCLPW